MSRMESNARLFSAAEVCLGRQRSPQHESGAHMLPYLRAANVKDGELDLSSIKEMNFNPVEQETFRLRTGDVLITEGSGSITAIGASAVWREDIPGPVCFQNTLIRLRPRPGVADGRYLGWWARSAYASGQFASIASGANIYHISCERVKVMPITLPPLDKQRRTADFLDAETAHVDLLIRQRTRQRDLLDELALSMIDDAISQVQDAPTVRLGYVSVVQTGITVDGSRQHDDNIVTLPYLRVANVQAGYIDLDDISEITVPRRAAAACRLRFGDVLMTEGGDLDKLGRGTVWRGEIDGCLHQNHVFAVRPDANIVIPEYLALMTRTPLARKYFESTGNKTTNLASTSSSKIRDFRIPLADTDTQRAIVKDVDAKLISISQFEERISHQLALLAERRKALITGAVTGQMDVTTARGLSSSGSGSA